MIKEDNLPSILAGLNILWLVGRGIRDPREITLPWFVLSGFRELAAGDKTERYEH
jgi:hypothetical protein